MTNSEKSDLCLIAGVSLGHLVLCEAQGLKVISGPTSIDLPFSKHHKKEKHEGMFQKKSDTLGTFEPHTPYKEIDKRYHAKIMSDYLEGVVDDYKSLVLIAEPKMMGYMREIMAPRVKAKITNEITKEIIREDKDAVERVVFGG